MHQIIDQRLAHWFPTTTAAAASQTVFSSIYYYAVLLLKATAVDKNTYSAIRSPGSKFTKIFSDEASET